MKRSFTRWVLVIFSIYLVLPLYWLLSMAMQSNADIVGEFSVLPGAPTWANFAEYFPIRFGTRRSAIR